MVILTFFAVAAILGALAYAFLPGELSIASRLSRMQSASVPVRQSRFKEKQEQRLKDALASVGKLASARGASSQSQLMLLRAGIRRPEARQAIAGVRILLPVILMAVAYFSGLYRGRAVLVFAVSALLGYALPEIWLLRKVSARQQRLRVALPDGLDLLVICVEAGLGLDQALLRVSQELQRSHRDFSDELQLVTTEMRLGKTRVDALRELGRRTGLEDIKGLVTMLIQTERFGTSITQSLRVFSDDLRTKRRQRAEEKAAKISIKMVPVLVLFIFPALMIVVLGPAIVTIMRQFLKM
ncbi:MAG TPA: type II secretion system F family protein [Candidatus Acidoferrales bacterium]|nr:type II secretion system F family protein [Candidatus Acidoferrales bacterium]